MSRMTNQAMGFTVIHHDRIWTRSCYRDSIRRVRLNVKGTDQPNVRLLPDFRASLPLYRAFLSPARAGGAFPSPGSCVQGSNTPKPGKSKSRAFRVTRTMPWAMAVAARLHFMARHFHVLYFLIRYLFPASFTLDGPP